MRRTAVRVLAITIVLGCGRDESTPSATVHVDVASATSSQAAPSPSTTSSAAPTSSTTPTAVSAAPPDVHPPPVSQCSPGQANTPCLFRRGAECFLRRTNCASLPCTESAPERVDCSIYDSARAVNACIVLDRCSGVSDEGCTLAPDCRVGMQTCIRPACAAKIMAAKSCADVKSVGCVL